MADIVRIAIEPSLTMVPNLTGIARYSETLLNALREIARDSGHAAEIVEVDYPRVLKNIRYGALRKFLYLLWLNLIFPWWLRQKKIDLVHHTNFLAPILIKPTKTIVTVHDMRYKRLKGFSPFYRWYRDVMIRYSCKRADAIITISRCSADDIANIIHIDPDKIYVIYFGIDEMFRKTQASEETPETSERYLLMVGPLLEIKKHITRPKGFSMLL